MKIGLIVKSNSKELLPLAKQIVSWADSHKLSILLDEDALNTLSLPHLQTKELVEGSDIVITLGGDGTLLSAARYATPTGPIFVAVNFGRLCFLTEVASEDLITCLESILSSTATIESRNTLSYKVTRAEAELISSKVLNDVVIQKSAGSRLVDLDISLADEPFLSTRGDGVIFATPTGSTAYSLSAGGAIVHPSLEAILLTPLCPHSLTSRPLVLPFSSSLSLVVPEDANLTLSADGQVTIELKANDIIEISGSSTPVKLVKAPKEGYFKLLRNKLNWGAPNSNLG